MEKFEIEAYDRLLKMVKSEVRYHYDSLLNDLVCEIGDMSNIEHSQLVAAHKNLVDIYHLLEENCGTVSLTEKGKIAEKIGIKPYLIGNFIVSSVKNITDVLK